MASNNDNNGITPIPALPPIRGINSHRYRDGLPIIFLAKTVHQELRHIVKIHHHRIAST